MGLSEGGQEAVSMRKKGHNSSIYSNRMVNHQDNIVQYACNLGKADRLELAVPRPWRNGEE